MLHDSSCNWFRINSRPNLDHNPYLFLLRHCFLLQICKIGTKSDHLLLRRSCCASPTTGCYNETVVQVQPLVVTTKLLCKSNHWLLRRNCCASLTTCCYVEAVERPTETQQVSSDHTEELGPGVVTNCHGCTRAQSGSSGPSY